ncbi:hypothetical protein CYLTODRAFT_492267 [Cylindrobasidium torrendii FP15055 ss-10]|uniref:Uncharacterized protein n=1 Tax=Cylindrobasidium torrendii FP15055 ss-10 TaxID=1314674 RepID=A0A0D7B5M8_9AGAR|nr:hypothetical protein CYLTODRAFT_492267 [Cylindrobasidium torrendii FP15055 ss-10]
MSNTKPPYYILFAHSSSPSAPPIYGHPSIQYHYADDSPLNLLPRENENVILMDYTPESTGLPPVRSISNTLAVTGITSKDPLVSSSTEGLNEQMYIIETVALDDNEKRVNSDGKSARDVVAEFKQKNAVLRRALHSQPSGSATAIPPTPSAPRQIPAPSGSSSTLSPLALSPVP